MAVKQTERQKKLAKELILNATRDKPKNKADMLESIGYTRNTARHIPHKIINSKGVQQDINPVIEKLKKARDRAISLLPKKEQDAKYRDLNDGIDKFTKNIELLQGNATERVQSIDITEEQRARILAEENNRA